MMIKWLLLFTYLLLLINQVSCHKNGTSLKRNANKKHDMKERIKENRMKRSLSSEAAKILLPLNTKFIESELKKENQINTDLEQPFWGMRGRRESSEELHADTQKSCKNCYKGLLTNTGDIKEILSPFWGNRGRRSSEEIDNIIPVNPFRGNRGRRQDDEDDPFWGNRGRRQDDEDDPFWGNRGRRQDDEDDPFWGNRGLRQDDEDDPFWGNRGRRQDDEDDPFWGNRGRRQDDEDDPFWGNRGRRQDDEDDPFWGNRGRRQDDEDDPFWGNRGRRQDDEDDPFWGNRGRRKEIKDNEKILNGIRKQDELEPFWGKRIRRKAGKLTANGVFIDDVEPFWGNRGRRDAIEPFWGSRGKRKNRSSNINMQGGLSKAQLRDNILRTMNSFENNMASTRLRRSDDVIDYSNQGKERKLLQLLTGIKGNKLRRKANSDTSDFGLHFKPTEPETILDDRIYADQPRYILVERSSRSSAEEDPFFITRGKKFSKFESPRGRRGAIEELVKSVKNDPYYIARGKKSPEGVKIGNAKVSKTDFDKASELICSTIDLLSKRDKNKVKRDVNESDRDRRTILKKLAAQLQDDPYFVSRGKKDISADNGTLDLINQMASKCDSRY